MEARKKGAKLTCKLRRTPLKTADGHRHPTLHSLHHFGGRFRKIVVCFPWQRSKRARFRLGIQQPIVWLQRQVTSRERLLHIA